MITFTSLLLNLRRRSQDLRNSNGTIIVDASYNGIRWTSKELIDILNSAIGEYLRYRRVIYPIEGIYHSILEFDKGELEKSAFYPRIVKVLNLEYNEGELGPSALFVESPPHQFFASKRKLTTLRDSDIQPQWLETKDKIFILPSWTVYLTAIYIADHTVRYTLEDEVETFGHDDIILDIAERELRDREHNWERSKILDERIVFKLKSIGLNYVTDK